MTFSSQTLRLVSSLAAALLLSGCAAFAPPERVAAGGFTLAAWTRFASGPGAETLTVYIESDGAPWARRDAPPADPTPRDSLALRLARADSAPAVAWLARPCQYLEPGELAACDSRYWRRARYAPEVIDATSAALDRLLERSGAHRIVLVGYSGGGAVAALVAARRSDVELLVTVGGVLDTRAWTTWHAITPLDASLNPADTPTLAGLRQVHFVGTEDEVTPPALAEAFAARMGPPARVVRVPGHDHACCWVGDWPRLITELRENSS